MAQHSSPSEVTFRLTRRRSSVPRARALLRGALTDWGVAQSVGETGELVLSELVTNALRAQAPHDRQVGVHITCSDSGTLLRLEVSDAGAGMPHVRAPGDHETCGRGLLLVEALAHRWGVEGRAGGIGKTVWAELTTPDHAPATATVNVEAATVAPGHSVRVWSRWKTVRTVRSEPDASGGRAVVLELDDGPALRLDATEPLTARGYVGSA
ncbi:ATP-binding protein [Streptomyces sp. JJ66]|uniref:ATP-binding protein n=1 Tax=Streptomyces sp. JJ66 TaxID=2803843 RepID=UPI001C56FB0E|nr:ATP-binding protein [Streptomyces sp. JJ66]MBW1603099.1 ATP-binding protein [Streptomyces sp. JJ66]